MEDVGVQVDQPRRDDLARGVDDVERGVGRDVVVDGGDTAARDGDVETAFVAAARIDDVPAANQQVEPHATSSAARIMSSASRRRNP